MIVYCKNDRALIYNKDKDKNSIITIEKLTQIISDNTYNLLNPHMVTQYLIDKAEMERIRGGVKV
jgi:hypothetical protein